MKLNLTCHPAQFAQPRKDQELMFLPHFDNQFAPLLSSVRHRIEVAEVGMHRFE